MKAGRLEERRPDSGQRADGDAGGISVDSTLPIVLVMGGWVEKWYMKAICRFGVDNVSREKREMVGA